MKINLFTIGLVGPLLLSASTAEALQVEATTIDRNNSKFSGKSSLLDDFAGHINVVANADARKLPKNIKNQLNSKPMNPVQKVPDGFRVDMRETQRQIVQCLSDYSALVQAGILDPDAFKKVGNVREQILQLQFDDTGNVYDPGQIIGGCEEWAEIRKNMYVGLPSPRLDWSKSVNPSRVTWTYEIKDFPVRLPRKKVYGNYRRRQDVVKENWKFKEFQARILPGCIKDKTYSFSSLWGWFKVPRSGSISVNTDQLRTSFVLIRDDIRSDVYKASVPVCLQVRAVSAKSGQIKPISRDARFSTRFSNLASETRPFTIIGFGDSYGSGEGNPARNRRRGLTWWTASSFSELLPSSSDSAMLSWAHFCHRSSKSGIGKAVLKLKDLHRNSNINFGHFACSGAKSTHLNSNFRGKYKPAKGSSRKYPGQLDQANDWLQRNSIRKANVDVVVASFGGNDAGFSNMIKGCVIMASVCNSQIGLRARADAQFNGAFNLFDGNLPVLLLDQRRYVRRLKSEAVSTVSNAVQSAGNSITSQYPNAKVYFTTYPNTMIRDHSASADTQKYCSEEHASTFNQQYEMWSSDPNWDLEVSESRFLSEFTDNVNAGVRRGVARLRRSGKNVGLIDVANDPRAEDRGWCRKESILRLNDQAVAMQGSDLSGPYSAGGWHPNDSGYKVYGNAMYDALRGNRSLTGSSASHAEAQPLASFSAPVVHRR